MRFIVALLALVWSIAGHGDGAVVVYLAAPKQLMGATVTFQGKNIGEVDEYGMASFNVPTLRRNVVIVTKAGFEPIQVVVDTNDGAGEIYPHIPKTSVHVLK